MLCLCIEHLRGFQGLCHPISLCLDHTVGLHTTVIITTFFNVKASSTVYLFNCIHNTHLLRAFAFWHVAKGTHARVVMSFSLMWKWNVLSAGYTCQLWRKSFYWEVFKVLLGSLTFIKINVLYFILHSINLFLFYLLKLHPNLLHPGLCKTGFCEKERKRIDSSTENFWNDVINFTRLTKQ